MNQSDALLAIWNNRPDLAAFYDAHWGAGRYTIEQAVLNWLGMTADQAVITAGRDPVRYAQSQGWVPVGAADEGAVPTLDWSDATGYYFMPGDTTPHPTLARQTMQAQAVLDFQQMASALQSPENWLRYRDLMRQAEQGNIPQWAGQTQQWLDTQMWPGMPVQDAPVLPLAPAPAIAPDRQVAPQLSRAEAAQIIWNNRPDLRPFYDANWGAGRYTIEQAVDNWLGMTTDQAVIAAGRDPIRYATTAWGGGTTAAMPTLDWSRMAGYYFMPGDETPYPTLPRQQAEQSLWQRQQNILATRRGPSDWLAYWRQRYGVQPQDVGQAAVPQAATAAVPAPAQVPVGDWQPPWMQWRDSPRQVTPRMWDDLAPSEQRGLAGALEQQGGWFEDWSAEMRRLWPRGQAGGRTWWQ